MAETTGDELLPEAFARWFAARGWVAHVSVTDETDYAASFVVVETAVPAP